MLSAFCGFKHPQWESGGRVLEYYRGKVRTTSQSSYQATRIMSSCLGGWSSQIMCLCPVTSSNLEQIYCGSYSLLTGFAENVHDTGCGRGEGKEF